MTAEVIAFPRMKKPRRETKAGLAARILPKVCGVLAEGPVGVSGGQVRQATVLREIGGFHFRADFFGSQNPGGPGDHVEVQLVQNGRELLDAWIYDHTTEYADMSMGGRVWLRRFDFAGRADWIPSIAEIPGREVAPENLRAWISGERFLHPST